MEEVVRSQIEGRGLWVRLWVLGTGSIPAALLARSDPGNSDSDTSSVASGRKRTPVSCVRAARTGLAEPERPRIPSAWTAILGGEDRQHQRPPAVGTPSWPPSP